MKINQEYISTYNTYEDENRAKYIVLHETDNFSKGANAERHAKAQAKGELATSVHYYCGDDGVFQAAMLSDGVWAIGKEYGGNHPVHDATNRNSINIEICVNEDGEYDVARRNAIELVKVLMKSGNIPAERVIRHYDAKGKYCPRKMMDKPELWAEFKREISGNVVPSAENAQVIAFVATERDNLRLRETPNGKIITTMPKGSMVTVLECGGTGNAWCKVRYNRIEGYCYQDYIRVGKPMEAKADAGNKGVCTGNAVRLRSSPGFDTEILSYLYKGDEVIMLERKGCWCRVQTMNGEGWMYSGYVKV